MSGFFHPTYGLRAYVLADAVREVGPLARGADGRFWGYADGVWAPADQVVHARIVRALGDRYRPHHRQAVIDVLNAELHEIDLRPPSHLINMADVMVEYGSGPVARPHDPAAGCTVQLPVAWDPAARCPDFDRFLGEAVNEDDRERVWEMIGYLMMPGNPLQRTFLLYGSGGNGKGVLLDVIKALLGVGNLSNVPLHDFAESRFATAELVGKLANICGDIDATFIDRTGVIKQLTGEDSVKAERKNGQPFSFDFWGKLLFSANAIPAAADSSIGWLRRWEPVNFPNAPALPDLDLKRRLTSPESLRGIAYRAVCALPGLLERRAFTVGASATRSRADFAERNNIVLAWIADDETGGWWDPSGWYERKILWSEFGRWYRISHPSGRLMSKSTFYDRLAQVPQLRPATRNGLRGYAGMRLLADTAEGQHVVHPDLEMHPGQGAEAECTPLPGL
jgi:P4 family phage/plasmid primase-like protien